MRHNGPQARRCRITLHRQRLSIGFDKQAFAARHVESGRIPWPPLSGVNGVQDPSQHPLQGGSDRGVNALARRALSVLVQRRSGDRHLSEVFVHKLRRAAGFADPQPRRLLVREMEEAGIGRDEICDLYIPEAARRMGDDWCDDKMSFADVSIGTARLQSMLRDLASVAPEAHDSAGSSLIVLVLASEDHTLGAMVMTGQLRRIGVSVRLMLGRPVAEVAAAATTNDYDGILISVAQSDDLRHVSETISGLRGTTRGRTPLIVGGGLLADGAEEAKRRTGADHATNDLRLALELCGCDLGRPEPA